MYTNESGIDLDSLEEVIGADCYEAAAGYVERNAVLKLQWAAEQRELWGLVQGSRGEFYTPVVYFSGQGSMLTVRGAHCSCQARRGCEHAAALLIMAAAVEDDQGAMDFMLNGPTVTHPSPRPPTWATPLESMLAPGRPDETTALAIELTLVPSQAASPARGEPPGAMPPPRLMARLVQPGKNGGWIAGSINWGRLEGQGRCGGYPGPQV